MEEKTQAQRNPKWHRDEIILALDLYFKLEPGQIHGRNPAVIELSEVINRLPIFDIRPDMEKFRNPNGVGLKLSNFLAIDPEYHGKGMQSFSKLDKLVFDEFNGKKNELARIANTIRATVANPQLRMKLYEINEEPEEALLEFREGKVLYKLHKYKERDTKLVLAKKTQHLKKYGALDCESCDFNFQVKYGDLGKGFIECHHQTPLYQYDGIQETRLDDLALVCSNCHRMLHRGMDTLSVGDLRRMI
ncbi:HNH endonuclease [Algoriphagus sp. AGSA1]|uniref:HNH endonuclease n=1 Tax=Algoriphagus sp. AGSA1 TaxID=2907213 RepID=UPI001F385E04|nr:HNH endonuclease [Algoriphagus sp. AGSA1]MCE7057976.1 HNH endonuclease [Algoriphagus sp. AGSA1]